MSYRSFLSLSPHSPPNSSEKVKEETELSVLDEVSEEADFRTSSKQSHSVPRGAPVCASCLLGVGVQVGVGGEGWG